MPRILLATALALTCLLAATSPASAATTCALNTGTHVLTVNLSATGDAVAISRNGSAIRVRAGGADIACTNGPTVTNTDLIDVNDSSPGSTTVALDLSGGGLEPGFSDTEPLSPDEIEITINGGGGTNDILSILGTSAPDEWTFGTDSGTPQANLNSGDGAFIDQDSDVSFTAVEAVVANPGEAADFIRADGSSGTGGLPLTTRLTANLAGGADVYVGGSNTDDVTPGNGNDSVSAAAGGDIVRQTNGSGDDSVSGGPGNDTVTYQGLTTALRADLSQTMRQNTGGGGLDRLLELENVTGGNGNDVLVGNAAGNQLIGQDGDDVIVGLGGDDDFAGQDGTDLVSYARTPPGATQGVKVDLRLQPGTPGLLGPPQETGGAGADGFSSIESVTGSPFADDLIGSDGPNTLAGLGGGDSLSALGGNDVVEARDGARDTVACGIGADRVVSDVEGVDSLAGDCETKQLDVRPATTIAEGPPAVSRDRTPTFLLASTKAGSFECRVDTGAFAPCGARHTTASLRAGRHTFEARARDGLGALDLSPASRAFRVDRGKPALRRAKLKGRTLRFRLSEAATLRIKVGKRTIERKGKKGRNRVKLPRRALKVKAVRITAVDAAGNRSKRVRAKR